MTPDLYLHRFRSFQLMHADYNHLLLRLYRLSHENPVECFQDEALKLLKPVLPFDSAMWGAATLTDVGIDIHTIHLHHQPVEMLHAYEEIKHLDTAAVAVSQRPCDTLAFDAQAWFCSPEQRPVRDYGRRFALSHFFIAGLLNPATRFTRWLTLFRASPEAHCTDTECQLLSMLMPHMQQAMEFNRLSHMSLQERASGGPGFGTALADPRGMLHHMDAGFEDALRLEWDGWQGPWLPGPLMLAAQRGEPRLLLQNLVISLRAEHGMLWLRARRRCPADSLSPREWAVARLLAQGLTHKQVAARLQRSPATVRNQIQSTYDKLGLTNVAALAEALRWCD